MNARSLVRLVVIGLAAVGCQAEVASPAPTGISATATTQPTPTISPTDTPVPSATWPPVLAEGGTSVSAIARVGIGRIFDSAISPDDSLLALGTSTGIYVYQVDGFEQVWHKYTEYAVETVSFSPDGSRLITGFSFNSGPTLWEAQTGEKIQELAGWYGGNWSPDGSMIAVEIRPDIPIDDPFSVTDEMLDIDYTTGFRFYDSQTGLLLWEVTSEVELVTYWWDAFGEIHWSTDGDILAAKHIDDIYVWDITSGQLLNTLTRPTDSEKFWAFSFSPDDKWILVQSSHFVGPENETIYVWDWQSEDEVRVLEFDQLGLEYSFRSMAWLDDEATVTLFGNTQSATLDFEQGIVTNRLPLEGLEPPGDIILFVFRHRLAELSPDENLIAVDQSDTTIILDMATGQKIAELPFQGEKIEWFHTEPYILLDTRANVAIWDVETQDEVGRIGEYFRARALVWLPNNQIAGWFAVDEYQVFDIETGIHELLSSDDGDSLFANQLCVGRPSYGECTAQDGHVAKVSQNSVTIYDSEDGLLIQSLDTGELEPHLLGWSADSEWLAAAAEVSDCWSGPQGGDCAYTDATLMLWRTSQEETITQLIFEQTGISSLAWSPDNSILAVGFGRNMYANWINGFEGNDIALFDPYTGQELARFTGHTGNVNGLAWSPDGSRLASASADGTIIIWDVPDVQ